ncbi:hypothetical protein EG328_004358 [Venturia inaequalis]|uniref:Pentatricopeptide repeat-containing protein-mitochondrial domain-containing protein n=1 Tax=Venturia inaequalis TaxID=5025 RepID=A0A8H3VFQ5_VENIN|nr:hypothetical protein EG328_004358 [Venturia inaequalis]
MPLPKTVLVRLSNNGTGNMANWLRQINTRQLTSQVPRLLHHPQCLRRYSTAPQASQAFSSDNSHGTQAFKRKVWNPSAHGQVLSASALRDGFTEVEKTLGRLRIEASHGSMEGGINAKMLADHLVRVLGVKPNMRMYSSLILANCSDEGSVAEVKALIRDLRADGLDLDSSACHDVLKVLSVHPDYILQTEILNYMKSNWFSLTENGWHDVIAMMLRDHQFELAIEKLDRMRSQGMRIQAWLYDLIMYKFAAVGELDEVLRLLKQRIADGEMNISAQLWYHLLDVGSRALHYELTQYIWYRRVQTRYMNPSSGLCVHTLNIAARQGDAQLAHDIISFLEQRPGNSFDHSHYELLIAAYINAGNLENALAILSVMQTVNVLPNGSTTRPVYQYLTKSRIFPREAFGIIRELHSSGQPISVASINCLIDAAIYFEDLNLALDFYKSIHELCVSTKPNIETFNSLLRGCRVCGDRKDIALILAAEMVALKIPPDALTYDRMMLICIRQKDDYEDGMKYFQEMQAHRMKGRYGTLLAVVRRLTIEADPRVDTVLDEMENVCDLILVKNLRQWVNKYWGNKNINPTQGSATISLNEQENTGNEEVDGSSSAETDAPEDSNEEQRSPEETSTSPLFQEGMPGFSVNEMLNKSAEDQLDDVIDSSNAPIAPQAAMDSSNAMETLLRKEQSDRWNAILANDRDATSTELDANGVPTSMPESRRRQWRTSKDIKAMEEGNIDKGTIDIRK